MGNRVPRRVRNRLHGGRDVVAGPDRRADHAVDGIERLGGHPVEIAQHHQCRTRAEIGQRLRVVGRGVDDDHGCILVQRPEDVADQRAATGTRLTQDQHGLVCGQGRQYLGACRSPGRAHADVRRRQGGQRPGSVVGHHRVRRLFLVEQDDHADGVAIAADRVGTQPDSTAARQREGLGGPVVARHQELGELRDTRLLIRRQQIPRELVGHHGVADGHHRLARPRVSP